MSSSSKSQAGAEKVVGKFIVGEKRSKTSAAEEVVMDNDDLLMEILVRLPCRTLIRSSQFVSKQWQSLIFSPSFFRCQYNCIHDHKPSSYHPPSIILRSTMYRRFIYVNSATNVFHPSRFMDSFRVPKIEQSSHGLLLIHSGGFSRCVPLEFYVYNPTTGRFRNLFIGREMSGVSGVALAFDPSSSHHYKVACLRIMNKTKTSSSECKFEVYDSSTQTWNNLGEPFTHKFVTGYGSKRNFSRGIYFRNRIYWIHPYSQNFKRDHERIPPLLVTIQIEPFCMDLEKGTHSAPDVLTPWISKCRRYENIGHGTYKNYLMESNGHLYCVSMFVCFRSREKSLLVFELMLPDDDNINSGGGGAWVKKYSADLGSLPFAHGDGANVVGVVRTRSNEDDEFLVWIHASWKMILFRFPDETFDVIELPTDDALGQDETSPPIASPYIESLASV